MKATQARKISAVLAVVSVALLAATLVLPDVKGTQTEQETVPMTPNPPGGYEIYGYGIPPVPEGTTVDVTLSGFEPRGLEYSLTPTVGNSVLQALAAGKVGDGPTYNFSGTAEGTYALELMIIAYNGSGYTVRYSGVWSSFDFLLVYTPPAVFFLIASLAATYYYGSRIPRQLSEEKVRGDLERERGTPSRQRSGPEYHDQPGLGPDHGGAPLLMEELRDVHPGVRDLVHRAWY